jgi:hypothetical protein
MANRLTNKTVALPNGERGPHRDRGTVVGRTTSYRLYTSRDATKSAIRRMSLGSASNGG